MTFAQQYDNNAAALAYSMQSGNELIFTQNKGQLIDNNNNLRPDILYKGDFQNGSVYLGSTFISYVVTKYAENLELINTESLNTFHRVDLQFVGANNTPSITESQQQKSFTNFYYAHCLSGITKVPSYNKLVYENVYPKIDIVYHGNKRDGIKYDFVLNPGANPNDIKIKIIGAEKVDVTKDNELIIKTSVGEIKETMPRVYQNNAGEIKDIECKYILDIKLNILSFKLTNFDKSLPLIIDPSSWITYLGGSGSDQSFGLDVDNIGNVVTVGSSTSAIFPATTGAFQTNNAGGTDAFISKLDANGGMAFTTFFGGAGNDVANGITVNGSGDIFIVGTTASTGLSTPLALQTVKGTGNDIFIAKFDGTGARIWSTYYGGAGIDFGTCIEIDSNGDVVVGGESNGSLPGTGGGMQSIYGGGTNDACVLKINNAGNTLSWATYFGKVGDEITSEIDIDSGDNIVIIGRSNSNNLATTVGASQPTYGGGAHDAFALKLTSGGIAVWCTYHGGSFEEYGMGIAADANDDIIITGNSVSPDMPISVGCFQSSFVGGGDGTGYLCKLDKTTGAMIWSTFYGTSTWGVEVYGVAVDKSKNLVYVSGGAYGNSIPTTSCAYQSINGDGPSLTAFQDLSAEDLFVARFNDQNGYQLCSSYIGGPGHEDGSFAIGGRIAIYNYEVYISGKSLANLPVTTGAYQTSFGGVADASVSKICGFSCGDNTVAAVLSTTSFTVCSNGTTNFLDQSTLCDTGMTEWKWTFQGAIPSTSTLKNPTNISYPTSGVFPVKLLITTPCGMDSVTMNNYINVTNQQAIITAITSVRCNGESNGQATVGVIGGQTPFNYQWSGIGGTNNSASGLPMGVFTVTVTDSQGCISSASVTISEPSILTATVSGGIVCANSSSGNATAIPNGGTIPYNYSWTGGQTNANATGLTTGIYNCTITDNNGCIATSSITLTQGSPITATITSGAVICGTESTGSALANASGGSSPYSYKWNNGQTGIIATGLSAGSYTVIITDFNGCTETNSIVLNGLPTGTANVSFFNNVSCFNGNNGSATATIIGGTSPYTFIWNNTQSNSTATGLQTGIYTCSITDSNGCFDTTNIYITQPSILTLNLDSVNTACAFPSGAANANTSGGISPYTYSWSNGNTNNSITSLTTGIYSLTVADSNGCTKSSFTTINTVIGPNANAGANIVLVQGNVSTLSGSGGVTYSWSPSIGLSCTYCQNPIVNPSFNTIYFLTVTDINGCTDTDSVLITTDTLCGGNNTFIPNAFSPNDDGENDFLKIYISCLKNFNFLIYNRWGEKMFETKDISQAWDGTYLGKKLDPCVLIYSLIGVTTDNEEFIRKGNISLVR